MSRVVLILGLLTILLGCACWNVLEFKVSLGRHSIILVYRCAHKEPMLLIKISNVWRDVPMPVKPFWDMTLSDRIPPMIVWRSVRYHSMDIQLLRCVWMSVQIHITRTLLTICAINVRILAPIALDHILVSPAT